ncbi:helix-turn-helix domain-containing protein [Nocardioides humi]|uniref:HTH cro/C1-type domain-containing protein n=1 Tax=Nocardioides humi TaxID=449461 RepID=A0ABN2A5I8_9ACTN|nr:helix-turn-helix transcriptional regulator [Nocardioides humi]
MQGTVSAVERAVLANALALARHDDNADVDDARDLARLVGRLGAAEVARLQEEVLRPVDDDRRTLTTRLLRRTAGWAWAPDSPLRDDPEHARACADAVLRLLTAGDAVPVRLVARTTAEVLEALTHGTAPTWRALVAAAMADPWSRTAVGQLALIDPATHPVEAAGMRAAIELCRRLTEEDERRAVASHIRSAIGTTGLTQREFAALVGTSPSRLSTYVTGAVTPSAAMVLRINRTARRAGLTARGA